MTPILNAAPVSNPRAAPTVAGLYSGEPRWAPYWKDIDPFTMGNITVEITAANDLVVSWNGVADPTGATTPYSFQIAFLATGSVEYRYDGNNPAGGGGSSTLHWRRTSTRRTSC